MGSMTENSQKPWAVSPGIRNECELSPERWWVVVERGC